MEMTLTELRLLATLGRHQTLSVNEAGRLTGIDKAWVSRSVAALVKRKLVTREPQSLRQPGGVIDRAGKNKSAANRPFSGRAQRTPPRRVDQEAAGHIQ